MDAHLNTIFLLLPPIIALLMYLVYSKGLKQGASSERKKAEEYFEFLEDAEARRTIPKGFGEMNKYRGERYAEHLTDQKKFAKYDKLEKIWIVSKKDAEAYRLEERGGLLIAYDSKGNTIFSFDGNNLEKHEPHYSRFFKKKS